LRANPPRVTESPYTKGEREKGKGKRKQQNKEPTYLRANPPRAMGSPYTKPRDVNEF